jgi:hypothetical protein
VFYALGRSTVPKFRTGLLVLVTYASGFVGQMAGQTAILLVPKANVAFAIPFSYALDLETSFTFLFVALSGFAFARLRLGEFSLSNTSRRTSLVVALIAFGFFFGPNLWYGYFDFRFQYLRVSSLEILDLALLVLPVVQFVIFYSAGRKISIVGRPFRYFGLLFIGSYVGTVLGTIVSVALFGQSQWSIPSNQGSTSTEYGIVFHNIPGSPLLIIESLIPVQSLPFLAFFAMSVSRLGRSDSLQLPLPLSPDDKYEHP